MNRVLVGCALLVCAAFSVLAGDRALIHVARRHHDDLARLRAAGVPVVRETSQSLLVEGPLAESSRLAALGYDVRILDLDAGSADYWQIGLRPDSDLAQIGFAGSVIWEEENWILLRVPRGLGAEPLDGVRAWLSPVRHEPIEPGGPAGAAAPVAAARTDGPTDPLIEKMVAAVTPALVQRYWTDLAANPPTGTRFSTATGARDSAQYCRNELLASGVPASFHEWNPAHAPNVVGEHTGAIEPQAIYILIGHLDDLPSSGLAPGADDNASGSANILAAAEVMACYPFRHTLRFIACTGEEQGLLGSDAYAAAAFARGDDIRGVINMDMIAWQGDGLPSPENVDINYNAASAELGQLFARSAADYGTGLAVDAFLCPSLTASDHQSFWERGYRAICGITDNEGYCGHGGNYPYYHQSTDTIANCGDPALFYGVVKTSVATLATLARPFKVALDRPAVACGGTVRVVLGDRDLNTNAGLVESVTLEVFSTSEPVPELLTLTENDADDMLFGGEVATTAGTPVAGDGLVTLAHGDTLHVRYVDALDCDGATNAVYTESIPADCITPVISDVRETSVTSTTAAVAWTTDEPSDSEVRWGTAPPPGGTSADAQLTTAHAVTLTGLTPCTTYVYEVRSADPAGNASFSDNAGFYYRFETKDEAGNNCHAGSVQLQRPAVACSDTLAVRLSDMDLNTSPTTVETVTVAVSSTTEPDSEPLVLTAAGPDSSVFEGAMAVGPGSAAADGVLQVRAGDLVTATYADADDGSGASALSTDTGVVDCAGPALPSIVVRSLTDASAVVEFTASEPATARLDWGLTPALGTTLTHDTAATLHTFTLAPLAECGRVYFRITATDASGNTTVHDLDGALHQFNAWKVPGVIFRDGFEGAASAWTLEGEWQIAAPEGRGSSPPDPASAHEGAKVLGHDLSGLGASPGNYERNTTQRAISPQIDGTALQNGELVFQRWLNTRNNATASVDVFQGGTWHQVWRSSNFFGESASTWSERTIDISEYADNNPQLRIAFKQVGGSSTDLRSGWNVDRLLIRDAAQPDFGACGGCAGAPDFAGATGAADEDACAASSVTVRWDGAAAWGTGDGGSYAVYRSTDPAFTPSPATLIASGVAGTSYSDTSAPPETPLWYVVRAENAETCGGGPHNGGVTDANLVRVAARDATAQPVPAPVGASLGVRAVNRAHVRLSWTAAGGAAAYNVLRGPSPGALQRIAGVTEPLYEDRGEAANAITWFYLVRSTDACGHEVP